MLNKTIKTTPRDFFMHLLVFGALYTSVVSFLTLILSYINSAFPDQLGHRGDVASEIIGPSSVLMIIFPVFIFCSWLLGKDLADNPEKKEMKFRKWLIYFTLFAAAVTIMVDLISLVSSFYQGELTARFFWKVLTVLIVATGVFWYYFWELKSSAAGINKSSNGQSRFVAWATSLVVLAAIVAGFFIVGTPAQQRAKRFDQQRVNDLQNMQNQLVNYWMQKEKLPEEADELAKDQLSGFILPRDPESGEDYEYGKLTAFSFKLCAIFKTENKNEGDPSSKYPRYSKPTFLTPPIRLIDEQFSQWSHGQGQACFERTIDPELYKKTL